MSESKVFQAWDYAVFSFQNYNFTLISCASEMLLLPYSSEISLIVVTVIGSPAEVYTFGSMVLLYIFSSLITMIITCVIYLPLFYRLNILSTYEVMEKKSLLFSLLLGMGIVISPQGGIKAVVWTDVFQICVMVAGLLAVLIQGSIHVGGFGKVWSIAQKGGRLNFFDFDFDPRKRHTFWSILIGGTFAWTAIYCCNQAQIQRYLACKSEREARKAIILNWFGMCMVTITACFCGLVMYAVYETCDPLMSNRINDPNQLAPLLVLDIFSELPGISGLFVASAFSGTLSTVSSGINSMSAVVMEDFISTSWKPWKYLSRSKKTLISKLLVVFFGFTSIGLAGVASLLHGNVMQISRSVDGLLLGPLIGAFTLAALCPRSNSKGTFVGVLVGLILSLWLGIGSQIYRPSDRFTETLTFSIAGCVQANVTTSSSVNITALMTTITSVKQEQEFSILDNIYSLSYAYYTPVGCLSTIFVGLIVSVLTEGAKDVDPAYLAPILHTIHRMVFKKEKIPPLSETVRIPNSQD
uniref:Sodium-coupled monocarboxylate transporter 2-like n=1 Tax=Callorhinchus milii TaxID=7868 RepID=A0A4W3KKR9_CALMI